MIHFFIGTKAQFIKTAPVMRELNARRYPYRFIDSGQHAEFTASIRPLFGIGEPDFTLAHTGRDVATLGKAVGWLSSAMFKYVFRPTWLQSRVFDGKAGVCVIHGDTVSTLIGAMFARRAGLAVAHLEAGLRSYNYLNPFPEELIRVWCMKVSTLLFAPDDTAAANLERMRLSGRTIVTGGNTVLDALRIQDSSGVSSGRQKGGFVLAACHRLETLRSRRSMTALVKCLNHVARECQVLFVLHKPTESALRRHGLLEDLAPAIERLPMQDYFQFIALIRDAKFVMADGGSIQEECAALGVPLLVLRARTERPDGVGTNAQLAHFNVHVVDRFLRDSNSFRTSAHTNANSPASMVADTLIEYDSRH